MSSSDSRVRGELSSVAVSFGGTIRQIRFGVIRPGISWVRQIFLGLGSAGTSFAKAVPPISKAAETATSLLKLCIFSSGPKLAAMSEADAKVNQPKRLAAIQAISAAPVGGWRLGQ
jgi:hypothetical protein